MNKQLRSTLTILLMLLSILACNLPGSVTPIVVTATVDLAATITAQAQLIQNGQPSPDPLPSSPVPPAPSGLEASATSTITPTITLTSTPSTPMVTVSKNTNCRTGPGKEYDNIDALVVGQSAEVVGKSTITHYWIIKQPNGTGGCWLWGEYATVTGDTNALKEYAIPATPTPTIPSPVANLSANKICFFDGIVYQLGGSIKWEDTSNNEDGFKIFFNGVAQGTIPANTTTYPIPAINLVPGGSVSMGVQAYNSTGKSQLKEVIIACP